MDSTTMLAVSSAMLSDTSVMYSPLAYEWWMGPTLFTILSLAWARFWPFEMKGITEALFGRAAIILVCLFLSMVSWIIGGFLK